MSLRKKTAPPTHKRPRSSSTGRNGLIAKEQTKKQSAKRRPVLDNRFHRTEQALSCAARAHVPKPQRHAACLHVRRAMQAA
jgi:LPS O-antigen subunit length determinant protein (WzzB/FepE family)